MFRILINCLSSWHFSDFETAKMIPQAEKKEYREVMRYRKLVCL